MPHPPPSHSVVCSQSAKEGPKDRNVLSVHSCYVLTQKKYSKSPSLHAVFDCGSTVLILTNGRVIIDQTTLGSVARFMCNNGFVLRGDTVTRTCEVTGWSGSNPSCGMP